MKKYLLLAFFVFCLSNVSFATVLETNNSDNREYMQNIENTTINIDNIVSIINRNTMTYIYGIMFSGKSGLLIETYRLLTSDDSHKVIIFAPKRDTTSAEGTVKSRDINAGTLPVNASLPLPGDSDYSGENIFNIVFKTIKDSINSQNAITYLFFDEAQFLPEDAIDRIREFIFSMENIRAAFFGLRVDVFGELFPGSKWFEDHKSDSQIKIFPVESKALCPCGENAKFSVRLNSNGDVEKTGNQVVLEGAAEYDVRCEKHRYEGKNWKNSLNPPQ